MNSGFSPKSIAIVFVAVLVFYLGGFYGVEHLRVRKGPWELRFETHGQAPSVRIHQPSAGVTNVTLVFHGESTTNAPGIVRFDGVEKRPQFGEVIYEDLTFLPGVVTLNLFGHEIELVPRTLVVNRQFTPWKSDAVIDLWPSNKLAGTLPSPKGNRPSFAR